MQLQWRFHPKQLNARLATSAAYQYRIILWKDGKAELTVQHRGDRPSEEPIKRFVYKNHNGALGGAQRFEDRHGYRDPAYHSPTEIVPFLPELPVQVVLVLRSAQQDAQAARNTVDSGDAPEALFEQQYGTYTRICSAVLCCEAYDCYVRTEIDKPLCAVHGDADTKTEE